MTVVSKDACPQANLSYSTKIWKILGLDIKGFCGDSCGWAGLHDLDAGNVTHMSSFFTIKTEGLLGGCGNENVAAIQRALQAAGLNVLSVVGRYSSSRVGLGAISVHDGAAVGILGLDKGSPLDVLLRQGAMVVSTGHLDFPRESQQLAVLQSTGRLLVNVGSSRMVLLVVDVSGVVHPIYIEPGEALLFHGGVGGWVCHQALASSKADSTRLVIEVQTKDKAPLNELLGFSPLPDGEDPETAWPLAGTRKADPDLLGADMGRERSIYHHRFGRTGPERWVKMENDIVADIKAMLGADVSEAIPGASERVAGFTRKSPSQHATKRNTWTDKSPAAQQRRCKKRALEEEQIQIACQKKLAAMAAFKEYAAAEEAARHADIDGRLAVELLEIDSSDFTTAERESRCSEAQRRATWGKKNGGKRARDSR